MLMLTTARLRLRTPQFADVAAITAMANDFDIARMTSRLPYPYRRSDAEWWVANHPGFGETAFVVLAGDTPVGCCGIVDRAGSTPELGYWFGRVHWGKGFATETVRALVRFAFAAPGCEALHVAHIFDNAGSRAVIGRVGFAAAGTSERWCHARGAQVTCFEYDMTRPQAVGLGLA